MKHTELLTLLAACTMWSCAQETYVEGMIRTVEATSVTDKAAVCGGNLNIAFKGSASDLEIQETGVVWAMTEEQLWADSEEVTYALAADGGKEGSFACKLEGLEANTTYYFWAYAHLKSEGEEYIVAGEVSKFTTLPPSDIVVSTGKVTAITKTTAVVGGSILQEGRPPYVERGVCYATSRGPTVASAQRRPAPGEGTGEFSVTLTGLTAFATYYVRAYATNANGTAYGSEVSFKAGDATVDPGLGAGGTATVTLSDYLAISDGLYYYFTPSSNAQSFYWSHYSAAELPATDAAIVEDMFANGVETAKGESYEGYSYDLSASTTYTLCMFAVDSDNKRGNLVKNTLTTKATASQPRATIAISSISGGTVYYSTTKNSYCNSYTEAGWYGLTSADIQKPDIYWAADCYENYKSKEEVQTANFNGSWTGWPLNNTCAIVTLGFTASGANSGTPDIQFFSTGTNTVITRSKAVVPPLARQKNAKATVETHGVRLR